MSVMTQSKCCAGVKTKNDKEWTNGLAHTVLKRYAERRERLALREKEYSSSEEESEKEFTK